MFHDTETVVTCSKVWILTNQVNINRRVQLILITLNIDYSKGCETSVNVNTSPFQDYGHPDNHIPATYETTPAFINLPQYYLFSYIPYIT